MTSRELPTLAATGIDVVVTDHHVIPPDGPPRSAYAVVNPSRLDCEYDKHVCGAGVAFLVMAKVRSALLEQGVFAELPSLASLLDFVAVATIADCVSLSPGASLINRAFLRRGMQQVRSGCRPCWKVFSAEVDGEIDAETIAFRLVPAIAASGRLDWAEVGFRFLIAKTEVDAAACWSQLKRENSERQSIERRLRAKAFPQAARVSGPAIVLFLEDGHSGVHGITASRVVEAFGKPCAIFAPQGQGARATAPALATETESSKATGLASGSFRSVAGIDVQRALKEIASSYPDLLVAFGGHSGSGGRNHPRGRHGTVSAGFHIRNCGANGRSGGDGTYSLDRWRAGCQCTRSEKHSGAGGDGTVWARVRSAALFGDVSRGYLSRADKWPARTIAFGARQPDAGGSLVFN